MFDRFQAHLNRKMRIRRFFRAAFLDGQDRLTGDGHLVLQELAKFCYANRPTPKISPKSGMIDPVAMGVAEGRREVFLLITNYLTIDDHAFNRLLTQYQQENDE